MPQTLPPGAMDDAELRDILARLHWSVRGLADLLDINTTTAARWFQGLYPVPLPIARWLRLVDAWLAAHPPPTLRDRDP